LGKGLQGVHASNLGALLAKSIGEISGVNSYIVDPVGVDEFHEVARITGLKELPKISLIHALNIKAIAHRRAKELGKGLDEVNFIIAHLGGGISIAPIKCGQAIDVNNAIQMGPMSPERSGQLPVGDLVKMCFSGKFTLKEMQNKVQGQGGLMSYLNTTDAEEILLRIENGDEYAKLIFDAMAYQISKEIGSCSVVLKGNIDNIILTGGLAYSEYLVNRIKDMIEFLGQVVIFPGEDEMSALNNGVLRIIQGEERPKIYEEEVK
jgi:butyrate kinase